MSGLKHASHTDEPLFAENVPVCGGFLRVTECHECFQKFRVMGKRDKAYLALVALVLSSFRLSTAGRAVLASRAPWPVLELADAAARADQ